MSVADERFWRSGSGKLTFLCAGIDSTDYAPLCLALWYKFRLSPVADCLIGRYAWFWKFRRDDLVVVIIWDMWTGITLAADSASSEPLVREMAQWLATGEWRDERYDPSDPAHPLNDLYGELVAFPNAIPAEPRNVFKERDRYLAIAQGHKQHPFLRRYIHGFPMLSIKVALCRRRQMVLIEFRDDLHAAFIWQDEHAGWRAGSWVEVAGIHEESTCLPSPSLDYFKDTRAASSFAGVLDILNATRPQPTIAERAAAVASRIRRWFGHGPAR